jgi:hypothetical protein
MAPVAEIWSDAARWVTADNTAITATDAHNGSGESLQIDWAAQAINTPLTATATPTEILRILGGSA